MEENIENEATKECSGDTVDNDVNQISTRVMRLLSHVEDFEPSPQDDVPSIELSADPRDVPFLLENAVRSRTMAKDEASAELDSYNLFEVGDDDRKDFIEHLGLSINDDPNISIDQINVMMSLIDDNIKLAKMRRVMDKVIGAKDRPKSSSDGDEDDEAATTADASDICTSVGEDEGHEHVEKEGQDVVDFPTIDEVEQSIEAATLNVMKIAKDVKQISEEIDKIEQKHNRIAFSAGAEQDEKENVEVREKGEFEESEKSDCFVEDSVEGEADGETADSSCSESATGEDTDQETTSAEEEFADQNPAVRKAMLAGLSRPTTFLHEHLLKNKVGIEYSRIDCEENRPQSSRYNYRCKVLDMEARGEGRNRAIAKLHVATNMLSLIIRRQENGTLPPEISPFTPSQVKSLEPILGAEVESSAIILLRKECGRLREKMPCFKTLSLGKPGGEHAVTVQCTALFYTAIGSGRNKRRARRDAAEKVARLYFKTKEDQALIE